MSSEFSGELAEDIEPAARGLPWPLAIRFLADPAVMAAADAQAGAAASDVLARSLAARIASREMEARSLPPAPRAWIAPNLFPGFRGAEGDAVELDAGRFGNVHVNRPGEQPRPWSHALLALAAPDVLAQAERAGAQLHKAQALPSVLSRLRRGTLRAFARPGGAERFAWIAPAVWLSYDGADVEAVMLGGVRFDAVHVHASDGLAPDLAALAFAAPDPLALLRRWIAARAGTVEAPPPYWDGRAAAFDWDTAPDSDFADMPPAEDAEAASPIEVPRVVAPAACLLDALHVGALILAGRWSVPGAAATGDGDLPAHLLPDADVLRWHAGEARGYERKSAGMEEVRWKVRCASFRQPMPATYRAAQIEVAQQVKRGAGGRPAKWDWESFAIALGAEVATKRKLPKRGDGHQAALEEWGSLWFSERNEGAAPVQSEIRERVKATLAAHETRLKPHA